MRWQCSHTISDFCFWAPLLPFQGSPPVLAGFLAQAAIIYNHWTEPTENKDAQRACRTNQAKGPYETSIRTPLARWDWHGILHPTWSTRYDLCNTFFTTASMIC
jgi:hypothetical protein